VLQAITQEQYISVLQSEVDTLLTDYYRGDRGETGTGHFNTAASVLKHRIEELKNRQN
jgi:hypothetical protein